MPVARLDAIHIRGLAARAIIGVNPEEREKLQEVILDITVHYQGRAGRTDDLGDAVDYKALKKAVLDQVERSSHRLLEALAESTADLCLGFPGVKSVRVTVDKPGALRFARSVAVEIERQAP
jgi:D-erythro-7,8-dihydroneopterin triphosphate epimerase